MNYTATHASLEAHVVTLRGGTVYVIEADGGAHCIPANVFELLYALERNGEPQEPPAAPVAKPEPEITTVRLAPKPTPPGALAIAAAEATAAPPEFVAVPSNGRGGFGYGGVALAVTALLAGRDALSTQEVADLLYPAEPDAIQRRKNAWTALAKARLRGQVRQLGEGKKIKWAAAK